MKNEEMQKELHRQLGIDFRLAERPNGKMKLSNPFRSPDGDNFSLYVQEIEPGTVRISDEGDTIMNLSCYVSHDIEEFFQGKKGESIRWIIDENKIVEDNGSFYVDVPVGKLSEGVFRLCQAIIQIRSELAL